MKDDNTQETCFECVYLTLNLLTTTIVAPPSNASKWQMGFKSAFKGLRVEYTSALAMNPLQELYSMGTFEYLVSLYVCNVCICMLDISYTDVLNIFWLNFAWYGFCIESGVPKLLLVHIIPKLTIQHG